MGVADIVVLLIIAVLVGLAIKSIIKRKKSGACCGCSMAGSCPHGDGRCDKKS